MTRDENYKKDKSYLRWRQLMEFGAKTGCHQKPERSFYVRGYQMPVCARCTGVLVGYLLAIPLFFITGVHILLSLSGCLIMLIDWFLQQSRIKESNNKRRLLSGILGGFGIMSIQLYYMKRIFSFLKKQIF